MKYLSILSTFKNEATILKEWIDYYLQQGFDHFYLIDNGSTDNFLEILSPYINSNHVTLYSLPIPYQRVNNYNNIFNSIKDHTEWLVVCDVDDYWYTPTNSVRDFINEADKQSWDVIVCYSNIFGSLDTIQPESMLKTDFNILNTGGMRIKSIARSSVIETIQVEQHLLKSQAIIKFEQNKICVNNYRETSLERFLHTRLYRSHPDSQDIQRSWSDFWLQQLSKK